MRKAKVFFKDKFAGRLLENEDGYHFTYNKSFLKQAKEPVSLTLPLRKETYSYKNMIPFFDGLIPEGWLLEVAKKNWKINAKDRMGLLLLCCRDCIGAVSIIDETNNTNENDT